MGPLSEAAGGARRALAGVSDLERGLARLAARARCEAGGVGREAPHVVLYEDMSKRRVGQLVGAVKDLGALAAALAALAEVRRWARQGKGRRRVTVLFVTTQHLILCLHQVACTQALVWHPGLSIMQVAARCLCAIDTPPPPPPYRAPPLSVSDHPCCVVPPVAALAPATPTSSFPQAGPRSALLAGLVDPSRWRPLNAALEELRGATDWEEAASSGTITPRRGGDAAHDAAEDAVAAAQAALKVCLWGSMMMSCLCWGVGAVEARGWGGGGGAGQQPGQLPRVCGMFQAVMCGSRLMCIVPCIVLCHACAWVLPLICQWHWLLLSICIPRSPTWVKCGRSCAARPSPTSAATRTPTCWRCQRPQR
jgi:hypothetical protein